MRCPQNLTKFFNTFEILILNILPFNHLNVRRHFIVLECPAAVRGPLEGQRVR